MQLLGTLSDKAIKAQLDLHPNAPLCWYISISHVLAIFGLNVSKYSTDGAGWIEMCLIHTYQEPAV